MCDDHSRRLHNTLLVELFSLSEQFIQIKIRKQEHDMYADAIADRAMLKCLGISQNHSIHKNFKRNTNGLRTGRYRGAAHHKCSITYFPYRFLLVVMRHLEGYLVSYLILKQTC